MVLIFRFRTGVFTTNWEILKPACESFALAQAAQFVESENDEETPAAEESEVPIAVLAGGIGGAFVVLLLIGFAAFKYRARGRVGRKASERDVQSTKNPTFVNDTPAVVVEGKE